MPRLEPVVLDHAADGVPWTLAPRATRPAIELALAAGARLLP